MRINTGRDSERTLYPFFQPSSSIFFFRTRARYCQLSPPYINIVVDVYPGEKGHSISARKQIKRSRERKEGEGLFFTVWLDSTLLWPTSHGYGDTFPRVSVDFRQESVDRGTRGYNETQNRINRVYNFGWRKVHLLFPPSVSEEGGRDWADRFEGKFHRVLNLRRRKGVGSISFTAAYDHRSEARSKSRSSDRRCKSDLPFGDPTNPEDSRGYFIRRLRLDYGGIRGGVRRFLSNPSRPLLVLMRSQWSVPSSGVDTVQTT